MTDVVYTVWAHNTLESMDSQNVMVKTSEYLQTNTNNYANVAIQVQLFRISYWTHTNKQFSEEEKRKIAYIQNKNLFLYKISTCMPLTNVKLQ